MKDDKITKEEFENFYPNIQLHGIYGNGKSKSLYMFIDPLNKRIWYEVNNYKNYKDDAYIGEDLDKAIEIYNSL